MHVVKFTRQYRIYNAGETAAFPPAEATHIERLGAGTILGVAKPRPEAEETAAEKTRKAPAAAKAD